MPDKPIDPENAIIALGKMAETIVTAYAEAGKRVLEAFSLIKIKTRDDYVLWPRAAEVWHSDKMLIETLSRAQSLIAESPLDRHVAEKDIERLQFMINAIQDPPECGEPRPWIVGQACQRDPGHDGKHGRAGVFW